MIHPERETHSRFPSAIHALPLALAFTLALSVSALAKAPEPENNPMQSLLGCVMANQKLSQEFSRPKEAWALGNYAPARTGKDSSSASPFFALAVESPQKKAQETASSDGQAKTLWVFTPEGGYSLPWKATLPEESVITLTSLPMAHPGLGSSTWPLGLSLGDPQARGDSRYPSAKLEESAPPQDVAFEPRLKRELNREPSTPIKQAPTLTPHANTPALRKRFQALLRQTFDSYLRRCQTECAQAFSLNQSLREIESREKQVTDTFLERRKDRSARASTLRAALQTSLQSQLSPDQRVSVSLSPNGDLTVLLSDPQNGARELQAQDPMLVGQEAANSFSKLEELAAEQVADQRGLDAQTEQLSKEQRETEARLERDFHTVDEFWKGAEYCKKGLKGDPEFSELTSHLETLQAALVQRFGHLSPSGRLKTAQSSKRGTGSPSGAVQSH
jgi:hypothetical protein